MENRETGLAHVVATDTQADVRPLKRFAPAGLLMVLTLLSVSACGTLTQELEQEDAASAQATTQIKASLVEADSVDAAAVRVELKDDVIVLSGFVASEEEASEAVNIAKKQAGEFSIKNELIVKP